MEGSAQILKHAAGLSKHLSSLDIKCAIHYRYHY